MAIMNVNPTRMQLTKLKKQLTTAVRGHKMLKDKRDELMRQFLDLVRETRTLRDSVEQKLTDCNAHFVNASNVMSVEIPQFTTSARTSDSGDIFPYGFAYTSFELDDAIISLNSVLEDLIKLAEMEKSCELMSAEIEKTRRRVNSLEHVMIPRYQDTIKYISMKLEENDRSSRTRLMKVKDMLLDKAHNYSGKQH